MDKAERFNKAFAHLLGIGRIRTQKDVAEVMQSTAPNISSALKGDTRFLTDKFLRRFNEAFDDVFNLQWLLAGDGEMLAAAETQSEIVKPSQSSDPAILRLIEELSAQRKMTESALKQADSYKEQLAAINKRLDSIEKMIEKITKVSKPATVWASPFGQNRPSAPIDLGLSNIELRRSGISKIIKGKRGGSKSGKSENSGSPK